jgi:hypothetical protein
MAGFLGDNTIRRSSHLLSCRTVSGSGIGGVSDFTYSYPGKASGSNTDQTTGLIL